MAQTKRKNQSQNKSSGRLIDSTRDAVDKLWVSMTFVQSRLLILQLGALLLAIAGIFTWYDRYFVVFYDRHPALSVVIVTAIPLYIICFSVGPQMWQGRRNAQRDAI